MLTPMMRKSKIFEGLKSKVIIENVQDLIENEKLEKSLVKSRINGEAKITWDDYYNYNEVKHGYLLTLTCQIIMYLLFRRDIFSKLINL